MVLVMNFYFKEGDFFFLVSHQHMKRQAGRNPQSMFLLTEDRIYCRFTTMNICGPNKHIEKIFNGSSSSSSSSKCSSSNVIQSERYNCFAIMSKNSIKSCKCIFLPCTVIYKLYS